MNVIVIDPDDADQPEDSRRNWPRMLGCQVTAFPSLACDAVSPCVVFIHFRFPQVDMANFAHAHPKCVVVIISGGTRDSAWRDSAHCYWRRAPVAKPDDPHFAQCAQAFLKDFRASGRPDFTLLEPRNDEARLALRLLCEAWVMNKGAESQEHAGITIFAPVTPEQWFHPFQEKPTEAAASKIAKQMGSAQKTAEKFLNQVAQLWDAKAQTAKGEVNWVSFEESVRGLEDALQAAVR